MKSPMYPKPEMWPIGTPVTLTLDNGTTMHTVTRSLPWQLGHGQWVVSVEGKSGGWDAARVARRVYTVADAGVGGER